MSTRIQIVPTHCYESAILSGAISFEMSQAQLRCDSWISTRISKLEPVDIRTLFELNPSETTSIVYSPATGADRTKLPLLSVNAAISASGTGPPTNETRASEIGSPFSSLTAPKD